MFKAAVHEEIKVPAQIDHLGDLRNFVTKAGRKHNFPATVVNAFKLCIDEAATNIIKHAYRDWEGMITMRVIIKKNSMTVTLIDQGKYFDPGRVADPDLRRYVDIGKKGGLGIFIMRKLLDEIEYQHTEEGNELRLTKYRDSSFRKKEGRLSAPSLSVSLKTRYLLIAAAILTISVMIGYFFFFFINGKKVFNEFVTSEKSVCEDIARMALEEGAEDLNIIYLESTMPTYIEKRNEIYRLIFTEAHDLLVYSTDEEIFYNQTKFKIPDLNEQLRPYLFKYKDDKENVNIYSFKHDIYNKPGKEVVGKVYLEVKKNYVNSKIAAKRFKDLQVAFIVLLIGYAGTFILVYFILNPFRKLATWIKDLGSGNVQDEIDFDSGDEVGEIAQAFSEMTDKVRQSQKNLAEQERIQKEMQIAQDIQQMLLPKEVPKMEGYEISSYYEAAKEVGGDYFDFVEVDKDTIGIVVADVSGKGVPGSQIMIMIRTALKTEARSIKSASEVLARLNEFVVNDMKKGMFVTLFYVIIDSKKRRINYASAGHNPMILYRQGTKKTYYLNPRGFPVGISLPDPELFKKSIESDTIQLAEDDILVIYTDGITEAMNQKRELFSEERLLDAVRKYGHFRAQEFIDKLKDEIHSFTEGYDQNDDITLVAVKERSTPEKIELNRAQLAHQMIIKGKSIREACEEAGITTYAYYNKYKKIFDEEGIDAYSIDETVSVEAKHLSIEEKTKIYDIIKKHPEYGAKRISEELNTESYGFTQINESRIYDELVRSRLNTRQLREAYIARSGKKKRMKPPGTPMLTLDGRIILSKDFEKFEQQIQKPPTSKEALGKQESDRPEKAVESKKREESKLSKELDESFDLESMMTLPIEDLLKKRRESKAEAKQKSGAQVAPPSGELEEEDKLVEFDFVEESGIEGEFEETADSELLKDESSLDKKFDELDLEETEVDREDADVVLEHEFSFRDIWAEQDVASSKEEIDQNDINKNVQSINETRTEDQEEISEEIDLSEKLTDDDILEDSQNEEFGFEELTDDISFKSELLVSSNGDNGKIVMEDGSSISSLAEKPGDEFGFNKLIEQDGEKEAAPDLTNEHIPITRIDEDDLLSEDEYAVTDFSFNDLLDEIESDISFFDQEDNDDAEVEFAYEQSPKERKSQQIPQNKDVRKIGDRGIDEHDPEKSFKLQPHNRLREKHLVLGLKFYQEQNYRQAVEHFLKVVENYPDFKEAYSILGNAYYRDNQIDKAIKSYERVKQIDPFNADAYENTGVIYANLGKFEDAIKEWKSLLEFRPDREDIIKHIEKAEELLDKNNNTEILKKQKI